MRETLKEWSGALEASELVFLAIHAMMLDAGAKTLGAVELRDGLARRGCYGVRYEMGVPGNERHRRACSVAERSQWMGTCLCSGRWSRTRAWRTPPRCPRRPREYARRNQRGEVSRVVGHGAKNDGEQTLRRRQGASRRCARVWNVDVASDGGQAKSRRETRRVRFSLLLLHV